MLDKENTRLRRLTPILVMLPYTRKEKRENNLISKMRLPRFIIETLGTIKVDSISTKQLYLHIAMSIFF